MLEKKADRGTVSVTGHASARIAPDTLVVTFGIGRLSKDYDEAVAMVAADVKKLRDALGSHGFDESLFEDEGLGVDSEYDYDGGKERFLGYRCALDLEARLPYGGDVPGGIVAAAKSSGVDPVLRMRYALDGRRPHMARLLGEAVADSREKAETLAAAVGKTVGGVAGIRHDNDWGRGPAYEINVLRSVIGHGETFAAKPAPVELGESVTVTWSLD